MSLKNVLILDTETTGLEPDAQAAEVAVIFYSLEYKAPIVSFASLLPLPANPAEAINHIPSALLATLTTSPHDVWGLVRNFADESDAIVAHIADFDRRFTPDLGKPWICSCNDVLWPKANRIGENLISLVLAHGCGVSSAHRAMADCDMLSRLFQRVAEMGHDVGKLLERGLRPKALFQANVPFALKDKAKALGFRWEADKKQWLRVMAIDDAAELPFPTTLLEKRPA